MKTSLMLLALAPAWAIVLKDDADPSTFNDIICLLQNGSPGVCTQAANCKSSSDTQHNCAVGGLICCEKPGLKAPVGKVGQKTREACLQSSQINKLTECPPLEIIPGKNVAVENQFPYMAALAYGNQSDTKWICSGVLISKKYILTTADCALNSRFKNAVDKRVRLGDFDITKPRIDPNIQEIVVKEIIPHPLFNHPSLYHNIALLKLETETKFSATVRPACLNAWPELPVTKVIATGFGISKLIDDKFGTLRFVDLNEVPVDKCSGLYNGTITFRLEKGINHSSICAHGKGRDTCNGDSGGALQVRLDKPFCQYSVVGLSSYGPTDCASTPTPGIYVRVSEYLEWIESIVWS